jgi:hypothetical protein
MSTTSKQPKFTVNKDDEQWVPFSSGSGWRQAKRAWGMGHIRPSGSRGCQGGGTHDDLDHA